MYCKKCGAWLNDGENYCTKCGTPINEKLNQEKKKGILFWLLLFISEYVLFIILCMICVRTIKLDNINGTNINTFISTMERKGYTVQNAMNYKNSYINNYYVATKEELQINFLDTIDEETADRFFQQYKDQIENSREGTSYHLENINVNDYKRYAVTNKGISYIVAKKNNTVIYTWAEEKYREKINHEIRSLGYSGTDDINLKFTTFIPFIAMVILFLVILWKIFKKAEYKGWYSLIPIYNIYILTKITFGNGKYALLCLMPIVNIVFLIVLYYRLPLAFGKSKSFAICNVLFNFITLQIIAFDNSKYTLKNHPSI